MKKAASKLFLFAFAISALGSPGTGQTPTRRSAPSGLVVVVISDRKPPAGTLALEETPNSFWASGFPRRPDWKMPKGGDPVQAISFQTILVKNKGVVSISLFSGKRFGEKVREIAKVTLAEGEAREISEMRDLGFENISLRIARVGTMIANLPIVVNPSPGLLVKVESIATATVPTFKVRFANNSGKAIDGIIWRTENEGRARLLGTAAKPYGKKLIEPNGFYDLTIHTDSTAPGDTKLILSAVVFEDGTVDGDRQAADNFLRFNVGRKAALSRIVQIFDLEQKSTTHAPDITRLIELIDAIKDPGPRIEGRPTSPGGFALERVVADLMKSLRAISSEAKTDGELASRLAELRTIYRDWYARLSK